jgi:cysteine desulfurase family protein (TIGR01976 family)
MPPTITAADRERIRGHFPALASGTVFLENAGGSQVPRQVADAIRAYMLDHYVQLGAGYSLSRQSTQIVDDAHSFVRLWMNGEPGQVILGPSTSALLHMLADCYADVLQPGQEILLAQNGHEANLGPWKRLAGRGLVIRWWRFDPELMECPLEAFQRLLTPRTAIVALPHVSNLLGGIVDLKRVVDWAHEVGARVVADGVAFAPHRAIDVAAWDVDWYAYSTYKVYGPHMAALYGKTEALSELTGPNHFFIDRNELPYKFELGGVCHEGCAGILALGRYVNALLNRPEEEPLSRDAIESAAALMGACEEPLQERLLAYLRGKSEVTIVGPAVSAPSRVGTISFVHRRLRSRDIAAVVDRSRIAIRHGHMYAHHLCEVLGLDPADGVVRVSLVHYNTPEEIEALIEVFETAL